MPISILRRQSRSPREPELPPTISALSLPDLTVPLIDPAAWAPRAEPVPPTPGTGAASEFSSTGSYVYVPPQSQTESNTPRNVQSNNVSRTQPHTLSSTQNPQAKGHGKGQGKGQGKGHDVKGNKGSRASAQQPRASQGWFSRRPTTPTPAPESPPGPAGPAGPNSRTSLSPPPGPYATSDPGHGYGYGGASHLYAASPEPNPYARGIKSFHRAFSPAPSHGTGTTTPAATARRGKARRTAPLTVMVVGPRGSGKTSFIDALTGVLDPSAPRIHARAGATTSVQRHELSAAAERRSFIVLDTPGLPPGNVNNVTITANGAAAGNGAGTTTGNGDIDSDGGRNSNSTQNARAHANGKGATGTPTPRARALTALLGIVEDRLAHQLSEETKVVRRKSDGAELVHLIIYVVDARTALVTPPPIDINWDTIAEPPATAKHAERRLDKMEVDGAAAGAEDDDVEVEARFPVEDIEAIRRFSVRANVLPILTHADALTTNELKAVRHAVTRDLATVFGRDPLGTWGILSASPDMDMDDDDHASDRLSLDSKRSKSTVKTNVPFAVFAPEPAARKQDALSRAFRWGRADAGDAEHSDLPAIRDAFVTSAEWLRTSTREVVYEKFRTEKLLSARGVRAPV